MRTIIYLLFIVMLFVSCKKNVTQSFRHELTQVDDKLIVKYNGKADVVQFKMFEGLHLVLKQNSPTEFEGELYIPDLEEGIFSYDIIIHQKDENNKMIKKEYSPPDEEKFFIWVGKNKQIGYSKANELKGTLTHTEINSGFLGENRKLTIYTPKIVNEKTPIVYLTDGIIVEHYAPYVDQLITEKIIKPIKMVGVHASSENRYKEYVDNGEENEHFSKHEDFFFKEILVTIEKGIKEWNGKRYMYGFSNGAAFCMYAGINHPETFEEIIAFSTADYISEYSYPINFNHDHYPRFYMGAGRYETNIFNDNIRFIEKLKSNNIELEWKEFVSGHDFNTWKFEYLEYIIKTFKN